MSIETINFKTDVNSVQANGEYVTDIYSRTGTNLPNFVWSDSETNSMQINYFDYIDSNGKHKSTNGEWRVKLNGYWRDIILADSRFEEFANQSNGDILVSYSNNQYSKHLIAEMEISDDATINSIYYTSAYNEMNSELHYFLIYLSPEYTNDYSLPTIIYDTSNTISFGDIFPYQVICYKVNQNGAYKFYFREDNGIDIGYIKFEYTSDNAPVENVTWWYDMTGDLMDGISIEATKDEVIYILLYNPTGSNKEIDLMVEILETH